MNAVASILDERVLVLNKSWIAVHVANVRRAIGLVYRNFACVVDTNDYTTYDFESWKTASEQAQIDTARCVRTPTFVLRVPEVIQLTNSMNTFNRGATETTSSHAGEGIRTHNPIHIVCWIEGIIFNSPSRCRWKRIAA